MCVCVCVCERERERETKVKCIDKVSINNNGHVHLVRKWPYGPDPVPCCLLCLRARRQDQVLHRHLEGWVGGPGANEVRPVEHLEQAARVDTLGVANVFLMCS